MIHFYKTIIICLGIFALSISCKNSSKNSEDSKPMLSHNQINWISLEKAETLNKTAPRDIFVMVHANWCPKCNEYFEVVFKDKKVIRDLNTKFYPVKINAHHPDIIRFKGTEFGNPEFDEIKGLEEMNAYHEILYELGAKSIPAIVFLNEKLEFTGSEMGLKKIDELRSLMHMFRGR